MATNQENPVVFISYSWDDDDHKEWVLNLANKLRGNGVDARIDRYYLHTGNQFTSIIEKELSEAKKVIIVFTPNYKLKAENQKGGVGHEYSIISAELYQKQENIKFLPILRKGTLQESMPSFIQHILYVDFTNDSNFDKKYDDLFHGIFDLPSIIKPNIGDIPPNFVQKINQLQGQNEIKNVSYSSNESHSSKDKEDNQHVDKPIIGTIPESILQLIDKNNEYTPSKTSLSDVLKFTVIFCILIALVLISLFWDKINSNWVNVNSNDTISNNRDTIVAPQPKLNSSVKGLQIAVDNPEKIDNPKMRKLADKEYANHEYFKAAVKYLKYRFFLNSKQQRYLGFLYAHGYGVDQSYTEALEWYRKAAKGGNVYATENIGHFYALGLGVKQNFNEAMIWYKDAASKGNATAMANIGVFYENGRGLKRDTIEAARWYSNAIRAGGPTIIYYIADNYKNGNGIFSKDIFKARKWYQKLADKGNRKAIEELKRLK